MKPSITHNGRISCSDGSDRRLIKIFATFILILSIIFYLSTRPVRYVDKSFLNDPSITPSRHFVEELLKGQNPRHMHTQYYLPPSDY